MRVIAAALFPSKSQLAQALQKGVTKKPLGRSVPHPLSARQTALQSGKGFCTV